MKIELRAVDSAGGRAIVREGNRWFLVSKDQEWYPVDLGGRARALIWLLSPSMVSVRQRCATLAEAILEARRACAAGNSPPGLVKRLLGRIIKPSGGTAADTWDERFPEIIHQFGRRLDRFFARRGCSRDESFQLSLETFRRLFDKGPVEEGALPLLLFHLASQVCPLARRTPDAPSSPGPVSDLDVVRIVKDLQSLDTRTLRCLYFWAVLVKNHEDTATLMKLSVDDVRARLVQAAARIGRSVDRLRAPDVVEACIRTIKGRRRG